ncbi:hypothetical protein H0H93_000623 [Arthromyces matolae]|nr:hypothetical protein H0H93_000623 [Arthromyces matolae]
MVEINYAKLLGINSVAGAAVFAAIYAPLFAWFARQSFGRPTYVFIVLSLFCLIRMTAFIIRACLAGIESVGENISVYIAEQTLFGVGFFPLLYSAYTLVLDRWLLTDPSQGSGPRSQIIRLTQNRRVFRLILLAAVVVGVVGASQISPEDPTRGKTLRTVSTSIFLALTALLAVQTVFLARAEAKLGYRTPGTRTLGGEHGSYILCLIAILLLVREAFATATINNPTKQYNEHFWYPLYALPEFLAVVLYATPGLIPPRSELPTTK